MQAEALASAARLADRSGEPGCRNCSRRHFVDHTHGAGDRIPGPDSGKLTDGRSRAGKAGCHTVDARNDVLDARALRVATYTPSSHAPQAYTARMLDLHYHLLPGIDDGSSDLAMSLEMARMSVADGVTTVACTPHIYPGLYENTRDQIVAAIARLQAELDSAGIPLRLIEGADVHLDPGLLEGIRGGRIPTLAGSRYLLLEPPHHVAPPNFEGVVFDLMAAGFVPVVTHPERLSRVETHYDLFVRLTKRGAWMQVTAGSVTGRFGRRVQYWADRFVDEGHCMPLPPTRTIRATGRHCWRRRTRP